MGRFNTNLLPEVNITALLARIGKYLIFLLLLTAILAEKVEASDIIPLTDNNDEIPITRKFVEVYEDKTGRLSFTEIQLIARSTDSFKVSTANDLINENKTSAYWLKFIVQDSTVNKGDFLIEIFDYDVDEIDYYAPDENGNYKEQKVGFKFPFSNRSVDHKNVIFPLNVKKGIPVTIYMRFNSSSLNLLEPIIRRYQKFIDYSLDEYILFGIFYGIMVLTIFYNLLYFFILKKGYYLYYSIYATSTLILLMYLNGTGFQYIWYNYPSVNTCIAAISLATGTSAMLKFFSEFFKLKSRSTRIWYTINIMICIRAIYMVIELLHPETFHLPLIDILYFQIIFYFSAKLFKSGIKSTKWFIIAYSIFNISCIISFLELATIIPSSVFTVYAFYAGVVGQFVFMSVGMAEAVREVFIEKNKAQSELITQYIQNENLKEKVNRELEEKVRERTSELEFAKKEIEKKAEENLRMNVALDQVNNKLQKYLTTFAQTVVTNTHVDFESFKKAYPDDLACMRYLAELKEKNGFTCKMCSNKKSIKGKAMFDIRCSRCNYNESITANTIFHKTKFSLQKAFYLLYLVSQTKTEISAAELSRILELQKATCQNFKNKISEKMAGMKKGNKSQPMNWDTLILDKEVYA